MFCILSFGFCVSLVLLFETKCQWIVVRPTSNVTYVTRAIFDHFFVLNKIMCLQYLLYKKGKIKANIFFSKSKRFIHKCSENSKLSSQNTHVTSYRRKSQHSISHNRNASYRRP